MLGLRGVRVGAEPGGCNLPSRRGHRTTMDVVETRARSVVARAAVAVVAALLVTACGGAGGFGGGGGSKSGPPPPRSTPPARTSKETQYALEVWNLVNQERNSRGVPLLLWDDDAAETAFDHAFDMADRDFFDHTNPDGEDPGDRLIRHGVSWTAWGENIAQGQPTPADVMDVWMSSPGHRENILDARVTRLGVGVYIDGPRGPWWVQDFFDD